MNAPTTWITPEGDAVRLMRPAAERPRGWWLVDHVHPESGRRHGRITTIDIATCVPNRGMTHTAPHTSHNDECDGTCPVPVWVSHPSAINGGNYDDRSGL